MSHIDHGTLHAYLDGELKQERLVQVEAHLADCPECRRRLDQARAAVGETARLMAELEPGPIAPPPWHELEDRAAARRPAGRRRNWLRPSLAWAASIAVAFGLGWFSRSYWTTLPSPIQPAAREAAAPGELRRQENDEAGRAERPAALEAETPAQAPAEAEAPLAMEDRGADEFPGAARASGSEKRGHDRRTDPTSNDAEDVTVQPATWTQPERRTERSTDAESKPAERQEGARTAAREVTAEADRPRSDSAPAAEPAGAPVEAANALRRRERETVAARSLTQPQLTAQERAERTPPIRAVAGDAGTGRFLDISYEQARTWLGAPLRSMPELRLQAVEVGPGTAVPDGRPGLPVVRQLYDDEEGRPLVLAQQWIGPAAAGDADPRLLVEPSGEMTYVWYDPEGYRLSLTGKVGAEQLRALAERVR